MKFFLKFFLKFFFISFINICGAFFTSISKIINISVDKNLLTRSKNFLFYMVFFSYIILLVSFNNFIWYYTMIYLVCQYMYKCLSIVFQQKIKSLKNSVTFLFGWYNFILNSFHIIQYKLNKTILSNMNYILPFSAAHIIILPLLSSVQVCKEISLLPATSLVIYSASVGVVS